MDAKKLWWQICNIFDFAFYTKFSFCESDRVFAIEFKKNTLQKFTISEWKVISHKFMSEAVPSVVVKHKVSVEELWCAKSNMFSVL